LEAELLAAEPGGLLGKVLMAGRLLPHVVILHTLPNGARPDLRRRRETVFALRKKEKRSHQIVKRSRQQVNQVPTSNSRKRLD